MLASRRWRDWSPPESSEKRPEHEPPKPPKPILSVLSVPTLAVSEKSSESDRIPPDSPDAWRPDFARWRAERCVSRQGHDDIAGIGCLLVDFAEWCAAHDTVPCTRATFERLLTDAGFRCAEGMVAGLVLRVDLEAVLRFQAAPLASGTPARATERRNAQSCKRVLLEGR